MAEIGCDSCRAAGPEQERNNSGLLSNGKNSCLIFGLFREETPVNYFDHGAIFRNFWKI